MKSFISTLTPVISEKFKVIRQDSVAPDLANHSTGTGSLWQTAPLIYLVIFFTVTHFTFCLNFYIFVTNLFQIYFVIDHKKKHNLYQRLLTTGNRTKHLLLSGQISVTLQPEPRTVNRKQWKTHDKNIKNMFSMLSIYKLASGMSRNWQHAPFWWLL